MTFRLVLFFVLFTSILAAGAQQDDPKTPARTELNARVQAFRQANYEEAVSHSMAARKKKADAASKSDQGPATDAPPR
jgi:hypothetical protein